MGVAFDRANDFSQLRLMLAGPQETTETVTAVKLLKTSADRLQPIHHYIDLKTNADVQVNGNTLTYKLAAVSDEKPGTYIASIWAVSKAAPLQQAMVVAEFQLGTATVENQIVERVGATKGRKVNVRVIAATNCDLGAAIENGKFRKDLYYRLSAFPINLPPVRERGEDGVVLAKYFLKRFSREMGISKEFNEEAINALRNYTWPGNVREIINKVRKAIIMANDNFIRPQDLDLNIQEMVAKTEDSLKNVWEKVEIQKLKEVLGKCGKNISKAAKMLGMSRPTIYKLKKKYGI